MILGLRRFRGRITTRRHARWQLASLLALCLIAAAVLLLLEGFVMLGIATLTLGGLASWLTGLWVMPGSVDGYYRKLSRVLRDIDMQDKQSKDIGVKELSSLTLSIAELVRSLKEDESYQEIVAECEMIDALIEDRGKGFYRVREIGEHRRRLLKFGNICEANEADPMSQELATIVVRRASVIVRNFDAAYELLESQARRVMGIKAPVKLKSRHQRYLEALNAYVTAIGDVREVIVQDKDDNLEEKLVSIASARYHELANLTQILSDEQHLSWRDPRGAAGRMPGAA